MRYGETCTSILGCYRYTDKEIKELSKNIIEERTKRKLLLTRTAKSYECEIKAHKRLYNLGISKNRTVDADCEEPISKVKDILFRIVGI